eukprot:gnl/TRDRNA2_/TRDRNA2_202919_c0_seq1.p1 gnl/TRDRNA2_/TRDRNA2_202919_c0~~gnl/TRDRNA2_/TRDRNA2_202919_c0_seq1.p1  ORF type:complete len:118 (+),score=44.89 gnl/TRDRNA2_/TRDRNA2_202919_c0_seq1:287-640(+)
MRELKAAAVAWRRKEIRCYLIEDETLRERAEANREAIYTAHLAIKGKNEQAKKKAMEELPKLMEEKETIANTEGLYVKDDAASPKKKAKIEKPEKNDEKEDEEEDEAPLVPNKRAKK